MHYQTLLYEAADAIAAVTLNRPGAAEHDRAADARRARVGAAARRHLVLAHVGLLSHRHVALSPGLDEGEELALSGKPLSGREALEAG
jgi:enoyl-CoA hydratase/carnithine racemase